jgi:hypothetical protein
MKLSTPRPSSLAMAKKEQNARSPGTMSPFTEMGPELPKELTFMHAQGGAGKM